MPSSAFSWSSFYERLNDVDPDLRQMALFDLQQELVKDSFQLGSEEDKCVRKLLECFGKDESNSEVHSNAVRLLSALVPKASKRSRDQLFTTLAQNMFIQPKGAAPDRVRAMRDNASLALKSSIAVLSEKQADSAGVITQALLKGVSDDDVKVRTEIFDVLGDLSKQFGKDILAGHSTIAEQAMANLNTAVPMLRKRATACLASLAAVCDDTIFKTIIDFTTTGLKSQHGEKQRRFVQLVSAVSRSAGSRFSLHVNEVCPLLFAELQRLQALEDGDEVKESTESDDTRENIMQALENILSRCPSNVSALLPQVIDFGAELLTWDPNYCDDLDDEEDDAMLDADDDDMDLEDDDDSSWKVRKSAARCLLTIVKHRPDCLPKLVSKLLGTGTSAGSGSLLAARFNERVENVRLEILDLFRGLLSALREPSTTGGSAGAAALTGSTTALGSFTAAVGAAALRPEAEAVQESKDMLVKALVRAARHKSPKVKLSVHVLLKELFLAIGRQLGGVIGPVVDLLISTLSDDRLALPHLRPDVLDCARVLVHVGVQIATSTEDEGIITHLERLLPTIIKSADEKYYRTVVSALRVLFEFTSLVPFASDPAKTAGIIFVPLFARVWSSDADQEVRRAAIEAIGQLLSGNEATLLKSHGSDVQKALDGIIALLRVESTRVSAARAMLRLQRCKLSPSQVNAAGAELTAFLRKTDRQVREQGLRTLSKFVEANAKTLDAGILSSIVAELTKPELQLLSDHELFLTTLALSLLRGVASVKSQQADVAKNGVPSVIALLSSPLTQGAAVGEAAAVLGVLSAADQGTGQKLFDQLLAAAGKSTTGPVASNLATAAGVVVRELGDAKVQAKLVQVLVKQAASSPAAITFLGEIGRHVAVDDSVVGLFEKALASGDDVSKSAAAVALGRAASGLAGTAVLEKLLGTQLNPKGASVLYYVRASRECFVAMGQSRSKISQKDADLALKQLVALTAHDSESVTETASESIGRLAHVSPAVVKATQTLLPQLATEAQRASVLSSVRFTMSNAGSSAELDEAVRQALPGFLSFIADGNPPKVRRAGLQVLTAAAYNRPAFLRSEKSFATSVLPALLSATRVDSSLIQVHDLGPFKHTVDAGLDMRKQGFECLSVLADTVGRPDSVLATDCNFGPIIRDLSASLVDPETDFDCWASARATIVKLSRHPACLPAFETPEIGEKLFLNLKTMALLKAKDGQDKDRLEEAVRGAFATALKLEQTIPSVLQNPAVVKTLGAMKDSKEFAKVKDQLKE